MEPTGYVPSVANRLKDIEMHGMRAALDIDPAMPRPALHFGREYKQLYRPKRGCVNGENSCYTSVEAREESRSKHIRAVESSHERLCLLASAAEDLGVAISSTARSGHHRLVEDDDSENSDVDADGSTVSKKPGKATRLLNARRETIAEYLETAISSTARSGHHRLVEDDDSDVDADGNTVSIERGRANDAVEKTLMSMVRRNTPIEELSEFFSSHKISDQLRGRTVIRAATQGKSVITEYLLTKGAISQEDRGLALVRAADNGVGNIIMALFASGPVSDKDRELALIHAAKKGRSLRIIHALQASGTISKEAQDEATRLLNAHREAIATTTDESSEDTLISRSSSYVTTRGITDNERRVERSLIPIVRRNQPKELTKFLSSHEISIPIRGRAVIRAATQGLTAITKQLLINGAISQEDRELALMRAANRLATGIIKILQANGPVSKEAQDEATRLLNAHRKVIAATDESAESTLVSESGSFVEAGATIVDERLVETTLMSMVSRNTSRGELREFPSSHEISNPIRGHHHRLVEDNGSQRSELGAESAVTLKPPSQIKPRVPIIEEGKLTEEMLLSMVQNNKVSELTEFLNHREISISLRGRAVIRAATYGFSGIVKRLLTNGEISQGDRERALTYAVTKHSARWRLPAAKLEIVRMLQANGSVSKEIQDEVTQHLNTDKKATTIRGSHSASTLISRSSSSYVITRGIIDNERRVENNLIPIVRRNQPRELSEFLSHHEIPIPIRGPAVIRAATQGLTAITKQLPVNGAISQEDRELALIRAANRPAKDIIGELQATGLISKKVQNKVNRLLYAHGHIATMDEDS